LPEPFDSCNTRGIFFSQLLDMTASGKVCINEYTYRDFDVDTWFTGVPLMLRPRLYLSFSETKIWEKVELISIVLSVIHKLKPGTLLLTMRCYCI